MARRQRRIRQCSSPPLQETTGSVRVKCGFGLFANRKIKKGKMIFDDNSLDYSFADVIDGDMLLFDRYKKASKVSGVDIPQYLPITREMLLRTHGVPCLYPDPTGETAGTIRWRLEVPGMMINHSCDPSTTDFPPCAETGEGYAKRTIKKGEELTFDYVLQYYNTGPFFKECKCGSANCRGEMMGFKALSDADKERLFPAATKAVQAMHLADTGKGPPVKFEQPEFPPRVSKPGTLRLVCPPPSAALAQVEVKPKPDDEGAFALYALKDFSAGDTMCEAWNQTWPDVPKEFDMVFASPVIGSCDPPEGTVVHIKASTRATRNKRGYDIFSIWQLLAEHSCEPNIIYDGSDEESDYGSEDEGYWVDVAAVKDIKAGEPITVDYNSYLWDRTEGGNNLDACKCGADKCTGTVKGFKFLPVEAQEERKAMTYLRAPIKRGKVPRGDALSKHVRAMWRKDPEQQANAPESDSEDDSSSSSS